jgi:hypothetical protein
MPQPIRCPVCDQSDLVEKVSTLYITGIGLNRSSRQVNPQPGAETATPPGDPMIGLSASELRLLSRRLKPPFSVKKVPFRSLHPDLVVLTFSLILPVFVYGIYTSQKNMLLPGLVILAAFYGIYFWRRKAMIAKFESQLEASKAANRRVEQSISRWMKLYYCAREDIVFQPGTGKYVPTDQMPGLLTSQATETEI